MGSGQLDQRDGMCAAAGFDASDKGYVVRSDFWFRGRCVFCCVAGGSIADSCCPGVIPFVRADVDGFVLPESATDCALFQEQL